MGDERKVQQIISSLGDAIIADSGRLSRPRARVTAIAIAAAVLFALIAAAALYNWYQSYRALNTANAAISELVEMTSETVQPNAQLETVDALLEKARKAINTFAASNDPRIVEQRARTYLVMAQIDFDRGRIDRMQEDARTAFANLDTLAKSGNLEARHLRAQAERLIGNANWELGNNDEAKLHYDRGIADLAELLKGNADPKISWPWMRSLADLYQSLGDVLLFRFNQRDEALAAFNKAREQRERLAELGYQGPALEHDLAWITNKRAEVEEHRGNIEEALKLFTEARDRMETLNDRIWDNLRWAADFGTVYANVARLKRKQNRFAEAAPIYGRAEEILSAVAKRDPKNVDRNASLNWIRFLRAENAFRLALQNSDRIRLLTAREQTQQVIATSTELMRETGQRAQAQLNKVREEALLAAIDANLRQLNGNYDSAALGFIEASDIIGNGYLKGSAKAPWPDLLRENIEYLEWAGGAYVKAQKPPEAQAMFKRAAEMLVKYREIFGAKEFEEFQKRIEARLDHGPPPASRTPAATERKPASPPAADRAPATTNATSPAASAPPAADPVPPAADVAPPADSAPPAPALKDSVSPPPQ
jgi:tetratricopeptide (TPR) repeat protein